MVRPSTSEQRPPLGSLEEQIKEAGRKVLHGTMSLILAASLVPTPPHYAFAESSGLSAQTSLEGSSGSDGGGSAAVTLDGDAGGGAGGAPSDTVDDASEDGGGAGGEAAGNVLEGEAGTDAGGSEEGSDDTGDSGEHASEPEGSEEQSDDVDESEQNTIESEVAVGDASPGESGSKSEGTKSESEPKSETPADEGAKKDADTSKGDEKKGEEKQPEASEQEQEEQVTLQVKASDPEGKSAQASAGDTTTTFYAPGTKVKFTFDESELPEGATLKLDGAHVDGEGDAFTVDRGEKHLTLTFNANGIYKEFSISGVQYTKDGVDKDATVKGVSLESELHVDAEAPTSSEIKIGDAVLNPDDLTPDDPRYIDADGKTLTIEVEDVLFDASASSVQVTSGTTNSFVATGTNQYAATVENLSEGPFGIDLKLVDKLGNESHMYVGADESGAANGALIIDNTPPELKVAEIGSKTIESGGTFNGKGVYLELSAPDPSLDQNESKVTIKKDGQEGVSTPWAQFGDDLSSYFPIGEEGTYSIDVWLVDKAGNVYQKLDTQIVIEQKAPEITAILSNASKTHQGPNDKTLITAAPESGPAKVTVRVLDSGFASGAENDKTTNVKLVVTGTDKDGNPLPGETIDDFAAWTYVAGISGEEGVWEHSVELPSEGTYDFHLEGTSTSDVPVDAHDVWTAELDAAAPVFQPLKVNGEDYAAGTVYARTGDSQSVTLDFVVTEEHFVPYSEAASTGTKVTITDAAGNDVAATTSEDAWDIDADGNHTYSAELTKDGTYTVTMTPGTDLVGNANTDEGAGVQRITIEVDTEGPAVTGVTAKDGTYKGKVEVKDGDKLTKLVLSETEHAESKPTVVVTLDEAHVGEKTGEITVTRMRGASRAGGEDYTVSDSWAGDGSAKTREIAFNKEGSYTVTVKPGTDTVGNKGSDEPTEFVVDVDNAAPKLPRNAGDEIDAIAIDGRTQAKDANGNDMYTYAEGAERDHVFATVTVDEEHLLDGDGGSVVEVTAVTNGDEGQSGADLWVISDWESSASLNTKTIEFKKDGTYTIKVIAGKDTVENESTETQTKTIVVDTHAPQIESFDLSHHDEQKVITTTDDAGRVRTVFCRGAAVAGGARENVAVTIVVDEAHPGEENVVQISVSKNNAAAQVGTDYVLDWADPTAPIVTLIGEGAFTITAEPMSDVLGNADQNKIVWTQTIVVDNTAPRIESLIASEYDESTAITQQTDNRISKILCRNLPGQSANTFKPVVVTVTLEESNPGEAKNRPTITLKKDGEPVSLDDRISWNDQNTVGTFTLEGEGLFEVTAQAKQDLLENFSQDGAVPLSVEVDNTAPALRKKNGQPNAIQIKGKTQAKDEAKHDMYTLADGEDHVSATVTVDELHFLDGVQLDGRNGTTVKVYAGADVNAPAASEEQCTIDGWSGTSPERIKGITFLKDGTYTIEVIAGEDAVRNKDEKAKQTKTIVVDTAAPRIVGPIEVTGVKGTEEQDMGVYRTAEGQSNVFATVSVDEAHMIASGNSGVEVTVEAVDGRTIKSNKDYSIGAWEHDDASGLWTRRVTFRTDGAYKVSATSKKDKVGNVAPAGIKEEERTQELELVVDTVAPVINSLKVTSGTKSAVDKELYSKTVVVTATVEEAHMISAEDDGVEVKVETLDAGRTIVSKKDYSIGDWEQDENTGLWTREVTLLTDGAYKVVVTSKTDQVGNAAPTDPAVGSEWRKEQVVKVDNTDPEVKTEWKNGEGSKPTGGSVVSEKDVNGRYHEHRFYGSEPVVLATIVDSYIDEASTKINGQTLAKIRKGIESNSEPMRPHETTIEGVTYSNLTTETGLNDNNVMVTTIKVTMTYHDRLEKYALPIVKAVDKTSHKAESDDVIIKDGEGNLAGFVVDTANPKISKAYINISPIADERIGLGSENSSPDENKGHYFFESGAPGKGVISVAIRERSIRTLKIEDPSGNYSHVFRGNELMAARKNPSGDDAAYVYTFDLATLTEGHHFTDGIRLTITDQNGRERRWDIRDSENQSKKPVIIHAPDAGTEIGGPAPVSLIEDDTKPVLKFSGFTENEKAADKKYRRYVNQTQTIELLVKEPDYDLMERLDPERPLMSVTTPGGKKHTVTVGTDVDGVVAKREITKEGGSYTMTFEARTDHFNDGHYKLDAQLKDFVGHASQNVGVEEFIIDTTRPVVDITYDNNNSEHEKYYRQKRTATIQVTETNFDPAFFTAKVGRSKDSNVEPTPTLAQNLTWKKVREGVWEATILFEKDGRYTLDVSCKDMAGNEMVLHDFQRDFVIDNEDPVISTNYESVEGYQTLAGDSRRFYAHAIQVTTTVVDRNVDTSTLSIWDPDGHEFKYDQAGWQVSGPDDDGKYTYTHVMTIDEADGDRLTPKVTVADLAGRSSGIDAIPLVVDKTAPSISVSVDHEPVTSGSYGGDAVHFFNQATSMVFTVKDIHELRYASVDDPDGQYSIASAESIREGAKEGTVVVALVDGTQSGNDTEYDRPIKFRITDVAGNWREWTLDRQGNVQDEKTGTDHYDTEALGGTGVADDHPEKLIQDLTAPHVELAGVTPGTYYNTPQVVRATVNEFNFGYLQAFDANRSIVFITKYEGNYTRAESSSTIAASQFVGERPVHTHDEEFASDGHYVIRAQFKDFAENLSNLAEIGEFTIDRTPPVITVTWDNYNAENGNHYKASRTATITVTEHNFNPLDFQIVTGGVIGGWSTVGDTHTITVLYAADGTYTLSVSGKDMAGNQAIAYNEPSFIIDTTMPQVSFKGAVQRYGVDEKGRPTRSYKGDIADDGISPEGVQGEKVDQPREEVLQDHHAYNGVVRPIIVFRDDNSADGTQNYNAGGVSYTVTDGGGNDVTSKFQSTESRGGINGPGNGEEFSFGDLGLVVDDEGNPVVDQNASSEGDTRYVYRPEMDGIYTMHAVMTDLAGNKAANDITFSVNRYGSTYVVEVIDPETGESMDIEQGIDGLNYHIVPNSPRIEVTEVNVSGSESEDDHQVRKEYANVPASIKAMSDAEALREARKAKGARPAGYRLTSGKDSNEAKDFGWSEYHYTIREGNFGMGSDSDHEDSGQGEYRVNVYSVDRATNDVGTDNYLDTGAYGEGDTQASIDSARRNAQVSFTLDEIAPTIEDVKLPGLLHVGSSYEASFYVNDVITDGDEVTIEVDGRRLGEGDFRRVSEANDGTGEYRFAINTNFLPFSPHSVKISVSDSHSGYEGHKPVTYESKVPFFVSILVPEIALVALVVSGVTAGVVYFRRRKDAAEPEMPGSYE